MAKILFINPMVRMEDAPRHPPYGIGQLAAICAARGDLVQVFDANAWRVPTATVAELLRADQWDVIGIGGITTTYAHVQDLLTEVSTLQPKPLVVLGGGILTSMPHEMMQLMPAVDLGVVGEAYVTFPEIVDRVDHGSRDWQSVDGVIWRGPDGALHLNKPRPLIPNLDVLPFPAWDFFPLDIYFGNSSQIFSEEHMTAKRRLDINGSFGCSLICRFCFHLGLIGDMKTFRTKTDRDVTFTYNRDLRYHSPDYIVNLAVTLRRKYDIDFVSFLDENLMTMHVSSGRTWMKEICEKWVEAGLQPQCVRDNEPHDPARCSGVHWSGTSHASLVDPEILKLMRQAGASDLIYGLESFSDRILANLGKATTAKSNEEAIRITLAAGIRPRPNQMMGFPDEFFDTLYDSLDAWDRLGVVVKPFFATPYPGTEWFYTYKDSILRQYGGDMDAFLRDLGDATNVTAVLSENFTSVELLGLRELMVRRDRRKLEEYEAHWRSVHGDPSIPRFQAGGWRKRLEELDAGSRESYYDPPVHETVEAARARAAHKA